MGQLQLPANKASSKINPNNLPQKKSFTKNFKIVNYQIMPPKPRTLSVSKQCEECGGSSPVACKSCTVCGADFYNSSLDKADSPGVPSETGSDAPSTPSSERRTTRRRDKKPDYYNALDFDARRREKYVSGGVELGTPNRPKRLASDKIPYRPAKFKEAGQENTRLLCSREKNLDKMTTTMIMIGERKKRRGSITIKKIKIVPISKKDLEIPKRRKRKN